MRHAAAFLLFALSVLQAQVIPGRFIVELTDEPATRRLSTQTRLRAILQARGFQVVGATTRVLNTVIVEGADAAQLQSMPGVRKVYPVLRVRKLLDHALDLHRIPEAWNLLGGAANGGAGIKIGILDTGIDSTHPGFQDDTLKIPEGFPKVSAASETANTNGKIIVARQYDRRAGATTRDGEGHGTGVAMIAAGRTHMGPRGAITGAAPRAWLGNYKVLNDQGTGSTDNILQAIDDAVADGMDIINMSLGSFPTVRPGNDILVVAVERAVEAGVLVVTAAGNEGPEPGTIGSPAVAPSAIAAGNSWNERTFSTFVRLGGNASVAAFPGDGPTPPPTLTGVPRDVMDIDPTGLACKTLPAGSLRLRVALILRGDCFFEEKLNVAQAAGAVAAIIYSRPEDPDATNMSVGRATLPAVSVSSADGLALREQLRADNTLEAFIAFVPSALPVDPNRIRNSSSRGPGTNGLIKPELLAVGSNIYTANTSQNGLTGWQVGSGTSFSSPMVAGMAALLKAARPGLTIAQYRSLLINSSTELSTDASNPFAILSAGAGRMNAPAAMLTTTAVNPTTLSFGAGASATAIRAITLTNLGTAADTLSITVAESGKTLSPELSQNTVALTPGASREITLRLTVPDLTPGQYSGLLIVRSTLSDAVARIPWWLGVPSDKVATITVANLPDSIGALGSVTLYARPTDPTGFPVELRPEVTVVSGGGRVTAVQTNSVFPGFYTISLRMGPVAGDNVFDIAAGGITRRVVIHAE